MRFAGVKELKQQTMELLKSSKKEDIIITAYGKPAAVLHHITEEDFEDYLIENDPKFKTKIAESLAAYDLSGGIEADALLRKLEKRRAKKV
ncbi:MAG: type II toxin-antitoxin system prevent-host-death family antitoxin [Nitrospirae bacterium]|nr:MAG: type II toxin-antitoxin system prevent-host-death family antitoxin [Nitrospirota bacterium]